MSSILRETDLRENMWVEEEACNEETNIDSDDIISKNDVYLLPFHEVLQFQIFFFSNFAWSKSHFSKSLHAVKCGTLIVIRS